MKTKKHSKKSVTRHGPSKKIFFIGGGVISLLLLTYIGISVFFMSHFFINTEINGHNFSGRTVSEGEDYLKGQVKKYLLTVRQKDGKTDTIKSSDIELAYHDNGQLKNVLKKQNAFLWPQSVFAPRSASITIGLSYDQNALDGAINSLDSVTAKQIPPASAAPKYDGSQFKVEPETAGTAIDMNKLKEKVKASVMKLSANIDLEKEKCYAVPKYTSSSEKVKEACDKMNKYCKASITYPMNENVVVDKSLISTWLGVDDDMNVIFHDDVMKKWLKEFANKYNTVGITRTFTTPTGKNATVSGGTYGWSINEDKELSSLKNNIKNSEVATREPAYYIGGTAAAHAMPDWGSTYVDVDLGEQKMWYVVNGTIALTTDVVTGQPIPERITPIGVYSLQDKKTNETLVGSIKPSTGEPEYKTKVSYWMRVTWDSGIGLHDATWQSAFGGTLYQIPTIGSHGCINMPLDQAAALYNMIAIGTPIIIHN